MADRINWTDILAPTGLRDFDRFSFTERVGTPGEINITLITDARITWWKSIKFTNLRDGRTLGEGPTQDGNHGPIPIRITAADDYLLHKFTLSKAKIFGRHTEMYDIFELSEKDGKNITLTWLTDGPDNVWQAIGSFFSDVANAVVSAVITIVRAVATILGAIIGFFVNIIVWFAGFILAIPIIGRLIAGIINFIQWLLFTAINFIFDYGFVVLGAVGVRPPEKLLRVVVIVQQDELGVPVATRQEVQSHLDIMTALYKIRANIKVIPFRPFQFTTPFSSSATLSADDFTVFESSPSNRQTLDVNCGSAAFGDDLLTVGSIFELKINNLFWGNSRRIIGYGAPIYIFAVRSYNGGTSAGCSLALWSNYVTVQFNNNQPVTGTAHECGHACNLWVHTTIPPDPPSNLMQGAVPATLPVTLLDSQVTLLRASSHCTYF